MSRLPVRWRVTAAFATALALVLLAAGAFIFLRMSAALARGLERSLEVRFQEVALLVDQPGLPLSRPGTPTLEADEDVAQILKTRRHGAGRQLVRRAEPDRLREAG